MLSIKESCRHAKFLDNMIDKMKYILSNTDYLYTITENHLKSEIDENLKDEQKDATAKRDYDISANDMAYLINGLIDEKLKLSLAINFAKKNMKIDWKENGQILSLDSAVEYNKAARSYAQYDLKRLTNCKASEGEKNGRHNTRNVEGNQTSFTYTIETVRTLDFDKKAVDKLHKKILNKTDKISELIDAAMLTKSVEYLPKYDLHDTMEDIIGFYMDPETVKMRQAENSINNGQLENVLKDEFTTMSGNNDLIKEIESTDK